jgi:uncharacterized protein involved in exopolysaccharide biosynthesis
MKTEDYNNEKNNYIDSDDIDLKVFFNKLYRNKKLIFINAFIFVFLSSILALSKKRIWEGQFKIVLNSEVASFDILGIASRLPEIANQGNLSKGNSLKTEVGILKSPSVLMPVFEFVNNAQKKNSNNKKDMNFYKWKKNNLKTDLEKGTSILKISYIDSNKEIILPALKKMSSIYQEYSGRNKKRAQELTKDYFKDQVEFYKKKSKQSLKNVQEFAIDQNLIYLDNDFQNNNLQNNNLQNNNLQNNNLQKFSNIISNSGLERIRVEAINEIRKIDFQIKKIKEIGDDFEQLEYIGATIQPINKDGLPKRIEKIQADLLLMKTRYKDKSLEVKNLIKKRDSLLNLLKNRTIGHLKARRIASEAKMEAAMRPKDIILQYKELSREASRDENTLINLENKLTSINLESAKLEDPWELITKPTLMINPVGPSRKLYALIGGLFGIFSGSLLSIYKEKKSGLLFEEKDITSLFDSKILERINLDENSYEINSKNIFLDEILGKFKSLELKLIKIGDYEEEKFFDFCKNIFDENFSFTVEKIFTNISNNDPVLLFVFLNSAKLKEIKNINNRLKNLNIKISGIIILKES